MFILKYFYKFLSLLLTSNIWTSLMCLLVNPFKFNKNLHNGIVNNKSTLFHTLINNWKKPNHLVLVIGEDVILYNDITQIILWCMIAGISFVSIYDYKNRLSHLELLRALKSNPVFEELNKLTLGFSFKNSISNGKNNYLISSHQPAQNGNVNSIKKYYADDDIHNLVSIVADKEKMIKSKIFGNIINNNIFPHSYENGNCCSGNGKFDLSLGAVDRMFLEPTLYFDKKTELNILSQQQCENDLLGSIIEISKSTTDVNYSVLQNKISERCPLPDPEVGIVVGKKLSTYGLLPWNIRLTEFFQFNNYYDISVCKFREILMKYSKCEQRFGK